ncbi:MAG TPA: hypothetical protein VKT49_11455 [Bryobacteraceae bacterium]|nr:hypothetical protein [Bryobacteraceae bacterium]
MAAFRRYVIALAVLALFAGLASAQTATMTCNLSSLNTTIRAESRTDLVSDLLITCTGGTVNTTTSTTAPTVNLTLTMPQPITSRIFSSTTGASEALLLIDDPGTSLNTAIVTGYGNNATPILCTNTSAGCSSFPNVVGGVSIMNATAPPGLGQTAGNTSAPNVYQGLVSGNSVTFFGVPVIPPGSSAARTFRITNVRVNASAGTTGSLVGSVQVVGGAAPLFSLNQTQATLATVQSGLTVKSSGISLSNCSALNYAFAGTVSFSENFASAFRTRVLAGANGNVGSGQTNAILQNVPGTYFSESGYEINIGTNTAGLADFGTRLKAVFNNIPSGVRVFVSFANVTGANVTAGTAGATSGIWNTATAGTNNTTLLAELITGGENAADSTVAPLATASVSSATAGPSSTGTTGLSGFAVNTVVPYVELTVSGGSATAVWEIINTNTAANETATFNVWAIAPAQQPTGQATVNASFAPLATGTIPSFVDPNAASPQNAFSVSQCKTILLFPYVTSASGFDTGIAIANTSTDTYGTTAQSGTCSFNAYGHLSAGGTMPTNPVSAVQFNANPPATGFTSTVASGDVASFAISQFSSALPGFTGYMIAVCNFQYAHGFAFVADWTSTIQSSAMGYLALILPGTTTRGLVNPYGGTFGSEALIQ